MLHEGKQTKLTIAVNNYLTKISEENTKYVLEIYNYLTAKGIKADLRGSFIRFDYKKQYLMVIATDSPQINLRISLCKNTKSQYNFILDEIEKLHEKNELLNYIADNVQYCNSCDGKKPDNCGQETEIFGERRKTCSFGRGLLIMSKKSNKDKNYYDHDMKMLKLILDLRIKEIDSLIS